MEEFWKRKLTPFDMELCVMIESLTGVPCEPCNGDDHFYIIADYNQHANDPDYIAAIIAAIEGRVGARLIDLSDDAEYGLLIIKIKFAEENYPALVADNGIGKEDPEKGRCYCRSLGEVRALEVLPANAEQLIAFIGNGQMEIPADGPASFHFLNAGGSVWAHAPEGSFIVYIGPGQFEVRAREDFLKEFESK